MTDGKENSLQAYVRAALTLQGFEFDEAQIVEISLAFARIEAMSQTLFDWPMSNVSEPAAVFRA